MKGLYLVYSLFFIHLWCKSVLHWPLALLTCVLSFFTYRSYALIWAQLLVASTYLPLWYTLMLVNHIDATQANEGVFSSYARASTLRCAWVTCYPFGCFELHRRCKHRYDLLVLTLSRSGFYECTFWPSVISVLSEWSSLSWLQIYDLSPTTTEGHSDLWLVLTPWPSCVHLRCKKMHTQGYAPIT